MRGSSCGWCTAADSPACRLPLTLPAPLQPLTRLAQRPRPHPHQRPLRPRVGRLLCQAQPLLDQREHLAGAAVPHQFLAAAATGEGGAGGQRSYQGAVGQAARGNGAQQAARMLGQM